MSDLVVRPCSHDAAKHAVMRWHYSRRMPVAKPVRYGVWENGRFVGAVIFGSGASADIGSPYGLDVTEVCELVRVALRDHESPVTQIVSTAMHQLRAAYRGLRLVVSYADPNMGHHGGIYQAGNWTYVGRTAAAIDYVDDAGRIYHSRTVSQTGWRYNFGKRERVRKTGDLTKLRRLGKFKYLYPLDRAMRRQVAKLAKPYPSADEVSTVRHPASGGEGPVQPRPSALAVA